MTATGIYFHLLGNRPPKKKTFFSPSNFNPFGKIEMVKLFSNRITRMRKYIFILLWLSCVNTFLVNLITKTLKTSAIFAGFGKKSERIDIAKEASQDSTGTSQIKPVTLDSLCPCCSGKSYKDCCKPYHEYKVVAEDANSISKARFSAFALGLPDFLISTCHPSHKEFKRHTEANLDTKKARKAWEKELFSKNSEKFEFLAFELDDGLKAEFFSNETFAQKMNQLVEVGNQRDYSALRVLVRQRVDGKYVFFNELSVYEKKIEGFVHPMTLSKNSIKQKLLYVEGHVSAMDEGNAKRMIAAAPQYRTQSTIQDRW